MDNNSDDKSRQEKKARRRIVSQKSSSASGPEQIRVPSAPAPEDAPEKAVRETHVPETEALENDETIVIPVSPASEGDESGDPDDMEKTIVAAASAADASGESSEAPSGKKTSRRKRRRKAKSKKPLWKRIILTMIVTVLILGMLAGGGGLYYIWKIMSEAPPLDLAKLTFMDPSVIYDINGNFYQELQTSEKRENVTIQEVPELIQLAFVSIEDQRF